MSKSALGVVVIAQNEAETVERAIRSFYDHVDVIYLSTDPERGHSGLKITPDDTLDRVQARDIDKKITILKENFCRSDKPMENEVYQRQFTADRLVNDFPGLKWVLQIDADEEFLDFPAVLKTLAGMPRSVQMVYWRWINLFKQLPDGRVLVIVNENGVSLGERFPIAHRPGATLSHGRFIKFAEPKHGRRQKLLARLGYKEGPKEFQGGEKISEQVLHWAYAKSEAKIAEKLSTWSHSKDFDTAPLFEIWKNADNNWQNLKDFHPAWKGAWPGLCAFEIEDLIQEKAAS